MKRLVLLLLAFVVGCANYPRQSSSPEPTPQYPEFTVRYTSTALSTDDNRWAPWQREMDSFTSGEIFFAVATTGHACLVPRKVYSLLSPGVHLRCDWRQPRIRSAQRAA